MNGNLTELLGAYLSSNAGLRNIRYEIDELGKKEKRGVGPEERVAHTERVRALKVQRKQKEIEHQRICDQIRQATGFKVKTVEMIKLAHNEVVMAKQNPSNNGSVVTTLNNLSGLLSLAPPNTRQRYTVAIR